MNFQTMNRQRKFILIAAAVGIIAMFLPWFSFLGIATLNGMRGSGIWIFLCFIGAVVIALIGDQTKSLNTTFWFLTLFCGALASVIMLWNFIEAMGAAISFLGIGFYIAGLASLGVLLSAYLFRSPTDSIKGGFDSLKKDIEEKAKNSSAP